MTGPRSLHVVSSLDPDAGGPTRSVTRLCEALNAAGAPAEIATVLTSGQAPLMPGITPVHAFPMGAPARLRRSPGLGQFLEHAAARFDLIHVHGLWEWPGVAARRVALRRGLPLIISPRGMLEPWSLRQRAWLKRLALATWEGHNLAACHLLHATAETEAAQFRALGLAAPACIVPNPVEFPEALEPRAGTDPRILLFLSRFHPKKGVDLLLQAWARIHEEFPGWTLRLQGPDAEGYRPRMEALSASLGLGPNRAGFGPAVEGPAKAGLLASASLFVLPSHSENFGNVVAEALAHGTPVVTTTGTPWQGLRDRGCGWWVPPTIEALEAALREALACSPEDLTRRGQVGRAWMREEAAPEAVAARMLEAYRQLLPGLTPGCDDATRTPSRGFPA